jgi:hypothetical protein
LYGQVVEGLYDCKSEVIGPGAYRFKAEIGKAQVLISHFYAVYPYVLCAM